MTTHYENHRQRVAESASSGRGDAALAYAHLAQAEQARIANLLALGTARDLDSSIRTKAIEAASSALGLS